MKLSRRQRRLAVIVVIVFICTAPITLVAAETFLSSFYPTQGPIHVQTDNGLEVVIPGDYNRQSGNPFTPSSFNLSTENNGWMNISHTASGSVTIDNIEGTFSNASSIDAIGSSITMNPSDKEAVTVSGDITSVEWRASPTADDGTVDFTYASSLGSGSVTLNGAPANTQMAAIDADTNDVLDVDTSDGAGQITFGGLDSGSHNVVLQTTDGGPSLSNPDPEGNVADAPSEFSIDVNDPDFPNDEVEVEFWLDGSQIDTQTATSNGTVTTTSVPTLDLGEHTWAANATDAYGATDVEETDFTLPSNVTFRNETNASQIVTGATVTATFYSEDGTAVIQREDSNDDGNISLEGLPATEFVVVIEADGFYTRRVYIDSIFNQRSIYLLNETAYPNAIQTTFIYEDRTGDFPPEDTTLRIQRAVDDNNDDEFEWKTIAGDFWGAAGEFPFTGQENARYRLIIENSDGTQRNLGTHIPTADGTKNVIVGQLEWPSINATSRSVDASLDVGEESILATFVDPENETSEVQIAVWELGNESNEIFNQTFSNGPYGTLNAEVDLTENQTEMSWVVEFTAETNDDGTVVNQVTVGGNPFRLPMDPWLLGTVSWIGLTFVACLYGPRTATLGAWVLVITAGMFMLFQWVYIPTASLIAAAGVAAGGTFYKEAMP